MLASTLFALCLIVSISSSYSAPPQVISFEFHQSAKEPVDEEFEQNLDMLHEIQEKVNTLAARMEKYKYDRVNTPTLAPEDNDIEQPADCESGCDVINVDTTSTKNKTNVTLISINLGGIIFPDEVPDDVEQTVIIQEHEEDQPSELLDADQETESENDIVQFPVALPENSESNPDHDFEIFDPSEKHAWADDNMHEPQTDNGYVRKWIIGSSDVNHDTGLFDSNIFTSQDKEYPEINFFRDEDGNVNAEDIGLQEQRHRQRFDDLFRILFQ